MIVSSTLSLYSCSSLSHVLVRHYAGCRVMGGHHKWWEVLSSLASANSCFVALFALVLLNDDLKQLFTSLLPFGNKVS